MIKRYVASKQFARKALKLIGVDGIQALYDELNENPEAGDLIPHGKGLRKHRVAIPGRGGKSGGARVIYYFTAADGSCYLFTIYAKNEMENLPASELKVLAKIVSELK